MYREDMSQVHCGRVTDTRLTLMEALLGWLMAAKEEIAEGSENCYLSLLYREGEYNAPIISRTNKRPYSSTYPSSISSSS
jgi:hypothetical protein